MYVLKNKQLTYLFVYFTLVAASERFLNVQRQFCTNRPLGLPRCMARACIPPASTIAGLLLEHTDNT